MKIKPLFLSACMLGAMYMSGQEFTPTAGTIKHEKALRPCLEVSLDPDAKILKAAWADYLKKNHDFKIGGISLLSNKDLLTGEKVIVEKISPKALNFYTHIIEAPENGSQMKVFAAFGYDVYIDAKEYPTEYAALQEILEGFINEYIPAYYSEIIEDAQDEVKDLTKEDQKLDKAIQKAKESITDLKEEIEEKQEELVANEEKIVKTKAQLETSKEVLNKAIMRLKSM